MKRFKKQLSWLLVVALVVSSMALGFGQLEPKSYNGTWSNMGGTWAFGSQDHKWLRIVTDSGADAGAPYSNIITGNLWATRANGGLSEWFWRLYNTYGGTSTRQIKVQYIKVESGKFNDVGVTDTQINNWFQPRAGINNNPNTVNTQYIFNGFNVSATGKYSLNYFPVHNNDGANESSCRGAYSRTTNVYFFNKAEIDALRDLANTPRNQAQYTSDSWNNYVAARDNALAHTNYWAALGSVATDYNTTAWYIANFAGVKNALNLAISALQEVIYNVVYYGNGATSGSTATSAHSYSTPKNLTSNGYARTGYTYAGWNTMADGSGTSYTDGQSVVSLTTNTYFNLFAKWTPVTYTVAYDASGGTGATGNSTHTYDAAGTLAANGFSKSGYIFAGWATSPGGPLVYNNGQSVTNVPGGTTQGAVVTLYARWAPSAYYVSYDVNAPSGYGGTTDTSIHTYGVAKALTANGYYRTGHSFLGWATSASGTLQYLNGDTVTNLTAINGDNIPLYALWQANTYTVTFDPNGSGNTPSPASKVVTYGNTYGTLATISRTGYTFNGWFTTAVSGGVQITSTSTVQYAYNHTLYARWTPITYSIIYNGNGSTSGSMSNSLHTYDVAKNLTANGYSKVGNDFLGWALTNNATEADWVNMESVLNLNSTGIPITFYAVWQALYYNITFDANGGTGGTGPTPMQYGTLLTVPTVTRSGHTLTGWTPPIPEPPTVPAEDTTYVAQWQVSTFTITWDANGGLGGTSTQVPYGDIPAPPTVTREGYTFTGWTPTIVAVTGATTYTAQWTVNNYLMTFNANGGSGGTSEELPFGSALTPPTVTRTGYTFASWSPAPPPTVPSNPATFVAQWTISQYTLTFNSNGGSAVTPVTADYGTSIPAPTAPAKSGYNFGGWYSDAGLTSPVTWDYTLGANNVTFYAKWTARQYTIDYNANTGTGTTASSLHTYDVSKTLTANGYTKTGYNFLGWALTDNATVPAYTDGQSVTNVTETDNGLVTFYAVWQAIMFQVSFDANGGTGSYGPLLQIYDSPVTLPTTGFAKTGHTFIGWNTTSGAATAIASYNVPAYDSTLYAIYTINTYTITFDANGGDGTYGPVTLDYGTPVTLPTTGFTRAGYNLAGWNTTSGATTALESYTVPAQNQTLYAVWTYAAADYSEVDDAIDLAGTATLPASEANDPAYRAPDGEMYLLGGFTNDGFYARSMFTSASLAALDNAVNAVVRGKNSSEQTVVTGYATAIMAAYNNLVLASADYSTLNALIAQAVVRLTPPLIFTEDSINMLAAVKDEADAVVAEAYKMPMQDFVNDKAAELENALNSMEYVDADYSDVELVWANRPPDLVQNYTPESVANLVNYYNQEIIWTLKADQQAVVNGYKNNLIALINALVLKPANYTGVDNALKAIPDNDGGLITVDYDYLDDIYNNTSVNNLAIAVNAVVRGKTINLQDTVDDYAADIIAMTTALTPLNADYTYLNIALNRAPAWPAGYYTDATYIPYANALAAGREIDPNLNITQQYIINDATTLINDAYTALALKAVTYTVKYQTGNGTSLAADAVKNATAAEWITETAAAVTGYTPVQATIQQRMTGTSAENIIVFTYTINSYTITFVSNGGTAVDAITQEYNSQVAEPSEPARAGYTFVDWYSDAGLTNAVIWPYTIGTSDVTFYAKWTANNYTVTFDAQGGSVTPSFISVTYDSTYGTLPEAEREGHTFGGWFTGMNGAGTQVNASTVVAVTAPQTLYAKWIVNSFLVTFDANGGNGGTSGPQNYGTAIVPPTVTRAGYTFAEWTPEVAATVPASDVTYTAQWTVNQYTVSFDANGGTGSADPFTGDYGTPVILPEEGFVKTGYTFIGWNTDPNATAALTDYDVPAADTTLYAIYEINQYTVTFDANGGTGTVAPVTQDYLTAVTLPTEGVAQSGYTFIGWNTDPQATEILTDYLVPAEDSTLYAVYEINQYTVSFDANGGTGSADAVTQDYNTAVTLPEEGFAKTGYTFIGWNTTPGAETALASYNVPAEDATLYAVYQVNQYTVTFDANGGAGTADPVTQNYLTAVNLPIDGFGKTGYSFIGWNTNPAAAVAIGEYIMPLGGGTLYAIYEINQYTVTFDANGGTGTAAPVTQDYLTAVTLPTTGFTKTGYTFIGWNTDPGATEILASYLIPAGPSTLYAVYQVNQYTVYFDANGGTGSAEPSTQNFGSSVGFPTGGFTKTGYTFIGWNTDPQAAEALTSYLVPAEDSTLYAIYEIKQYTVTFDANGGEGSAEPFTGDYGTAVILPETGFTKTGHTFIGWNTTSGASTKLDSYDMPAGDVTLYAVYELKSYLITFDANEGQGGTEQLMVYGTALIPPTVTREGYTFASWLPVLPETVPAGNTVYVAQWTLNSYTITWDANGGTGGGQNACDYGATPTAIDAGTKLGYTFAGWAPEIVAATGDTTYTAQWTAINYMITFDANGGNGGTGPTAMPYNAPLTAPEVTRAGYTLAGWSPALPATVPAADTVYVAQWSLSSFQITFDANGGTGGTGPTAMVYGTTLTAPTVTRTGYTFTGWIPTVPATVPSEDTTYTAQWTVDSYTVTFDSAGGSAVPAITQEYGTASDSTG